MTAQDAYDAITAALPGEAAEPDRLLTLCGVCAARFDGTDGAGARLAAGAQAWILYLTADASRGDDPVFFRAGDVQAQYDRKAALSAAYALRDAAYRAAGLSRDGFAFGSV